MEARFEPGKALMRARFNGAGSLARLALFGCAILLPGATGAAPRRAFSVRMTPDQAFVPQVLSVREGDVVVWKNEDHRVHSVIGDPLLALQRIDVEPPAPPEPFHSEDVGPGATYAREFTMAGIYRYVCLHHEEQGMNGTVIVQPRR
jgi:plastocyanin